MKIQEALKQLREEKPRKFVQTVDLIINLKEFDPRKEALNTYVNVPNASKKKICAFLTKKNGGVDTITKEEFDRYKNIRDIKRLTNNYDFFIAVSSLMPLVATKFGRYLGPVGKMPSPQAGIIANDDDESVKKMIIKMNKVIKVRSKEKSLKLPIGKESMSDEELIQNIESVLHSIETLLPRKKDNIKNIMVKFTMTKPIRIE